ncbi:MAG: hypothetical protein R3B91_04750 [Planctomycetaceae bacterium]
MSDTTSQAGGGHAHSGLMIYQGDNWPESYRDHMYTINLHGLRINHDTLERDGAGYTAKHAEDFLFANNEWFRGLDLDLRTGRRSVRRRLVGYRRVS